MRMKSNPFSTAEDESEVFRKKIETLSKTKNGDVFNFHSGDFFQWTYCFIGVCACVHVCKHAMASNVGHTF